MKASDNSDNDNRNGEWVPRPEESPEKKLAKDVGDDRFTDEPKLGNHQKSETSFPKHLFLEAGSFSVTEILFLTM